MKEYVGVSFNSKKSIQKLEVDVLFRPCWFSDLI